MKFLLLILCGVIGSIQAVLLEEIVENEWLEYKFTYNKTYKCPEENVMRLKLFLETRNEIAQHNQLYAQGLSTFYMAINEFSDWMESEVSERLRNAVEPSGVHMPRPNEAYFATGEKISAAKDWRKRGVVTKVKNQKQCGSCWAFSTTGALESHQAIKTGKLVTLSEQNLVDCSTENRGCNGGWPSVAFNHIRASGGIDTDVSYPYEAVKNRCRFQKSNVGATDKGYVSVQRSERALTEAIDKFGPISIVICSPKSFINHGGGIYNDPNCCPCRDYHAVLAVGYGSEGGRDYYIVKNSWGPRWGTEGGYLRMSRNKSNQCGIADQATYPKL